MKNIKDSHRGEGKFGEGWAEIKCKSPLLYLVVKRI